MSFDPTGYTLAPMSICILISPALKQRGLPP